MAKLTMMEHWQAALRAGTPLVKIVTTDIVSTIRSIVLNPDTAQSPMLLWDCSKGLTALNQPAQAVHKAIGALGSEATSFTDPVTTLQKANLLPADTILFMSNLHLFMKDPIVVQGIWNLRDPFKASSRVLVLVGNSSSPLPPEIASDVLVLDEPLPDEKKLIQLVHETYNALNTVLKQRKEKPLPPPEEKTVVRVVEAISGLPFFPAEQVVSESTNKAGIDIDQCWERKRQQIEQCRGLSIHRGLEKFSDITGLMNAKGYHLLRGGGPLRRRGVVFIDELDKHMAGFGAVGTGDTTTEMAGVLLTEMEDTNAEGSLFLGIAGGGKTLLGRAIANEWGVPCINFDMSGMKASHVGESGDNIRNALKVVRAITQDCAYYVATCNRIESLPPEMRRRFRNATFFFDLMTRPEKDAAWELYMNKKWHPDQDPKYKVKGERPVDTGWTAAEIRNCCYNAYVLNCSLEEASKYIIPISISAKEQIVELRRQADKRFISASYPGEYMAPEGTQEADPEILVGIVAMNAPKRKLNPAGGGGLAN